MEHQSTTRGLHVIHTLNDVVLWCSICINCDMLANHIHSSLILLVATVQRMQTLRNNQTAF